MIASIRADREEYADWNKAEGLEPRVSRLASIRCGFERGPAPSGLRIFASGMKSLPAKSQRPPWPVQLAAKWVWRIGLVAFILIPEARTIRRRCSAALIAEYDADMDTLFSINCDPYEVVATQWKSPAPWTDRGLMGGASAITSSPALGAPSTLVPHQHRGWKPLCAIHPQSAA